MRVVWLYFALTDDVYALSDCNLGAARLLAFGRRLEIEPEVSKSEADVAISVTHLPSSAKVLGLGGAVLAGADISARALSVRLGLTLGPAAIRASR